MFLGSWKNFSQLKQVHCTHFGNRYDHIKCLIIELIQSTLSVRKPYRFTRGCYRAKYSKRRSTYLICLSVQVVTSLFYIYWKHANCLPCASKFACIPNLYDGFEFLVSKETVVLLRRWASETRKFRFIKRVDKGWITTVKDFESWRFER